LFTTTHQAALVSQVDPNNWHALGMGVSKPRKGFVALPGVSKELENIIHDPAGDEDSHGPLPGKILLNEKFTAQSMREGIHQGFPIVHIASHFVLRPGSDQSYLLLGAGDGETPDGGLLTLEELNGVAYRFDQVQLLTLSACETGTSGGPRKGDGKEIDALGDLAESKGAMAVLATLWQVNDASTGELMKEFYELWTAGGTISKAEALRKAQSKMLLDGEPDKSGTSCKAPIKPYLSHPYYWAPFILIGNWQ
jgi:CHAT domain-containing protein